MMLMIDQLWYVSTGCSQLVQALTSDRQSVRFQSWNSQCGCSDTTDPRVNNVKTQLPCADCSSLIVVNGSHAVACVKFDVHLIHMYYQEPDE